MEIFLDTANIDEIRNFCETNLIDGITTNPSIIAESKRHYKEILNEICQICPGLVSAEVVATKYSSMLKEARVLREIAKNIMIKLPCTFEGIKACSILSKENIKTNMTLCFSAGQALLAAKAGATYVSLFVGRLEDISQDATTLIEEVRQLYDNYKIINTKILVASIRSPRHVISAALKGAECVTMPTKILNQLINHHATDVGLKKFLQDWNKTGQKIEI